MTDCDSGRPPARPRTRAAFSLALAAGFGAWLALAAPAPAQDADDGAVGTPAEDSVADDDAARRSDGGGTLIGREVVGGAAAGRNVTAAGAFVALTADTDEDAMIAGGTVRVDGRVGEDLFAAGGRVRIGASVAEDAFLAGGSVSLGSGSSVGADLFAAGGDLVIDGTVAGDAFLGAGTTEIAGTIDGDVEAAGGSLILLPGARIAGDLRFLGPDAPEIAEGATVGGTVVHETIVDRDDRGGREDRRRGPAAVAGAVGGAIFTLGIVLAGALWLAASPRTVAGAARGFRETPVVGGLLGLAVAAVWPLATLLLAVTVVGLPVAGVLFVLYPVVLFAGYLIGAFGLADIVLARRILPPGYGLRLLGFALAVIALALVSLIPFLGTLAVVVVFLIGLGALARTIFADRDEEAII